MTSKKPKRDDPKQSQAFIDAAKAMGADQSSEAFRAAVKAILPPRAARANDA